MWKNTLEPDRPQMTIRRMRIAYFITNDANAHTEYVIFIAFPLQQWLHERSVMTTFIWTLLVLFFFNMYKYFALLPVVIVFIMSFLCVSVCCYLLNVAVLLCNWLLGCGANTIIIKN